jgi:glycine/D-amino acid oxidase-like deaminating enzyme
MQMRSVDLIVIGAGVLGTFHAYFAAQRGYKTVLIERNPFPNDASVRNFGMIVQSIVEAGGEWVEHARATAEIYQAIQRERDIGVRPTGSLYIDSTEVDTTLRRHYPQRGAAGALLTSAGL